MEKHYRKQVPKHGSYRTSFILAGDGGIWVIIILVNF